YRYADVVLREHLALDGLTDVWDECSMGESTERHGAALGISRAEQDASAAASHQPAAAAQKAGTVAAGITPVEVPRRRGHAVTIPQDAGVRPEATAEWLSKLRPAFTPDGTITAGSASPMSDGAAALVVMSAVRARRQGLSWLAGIGAHGMVAGPDSS